MAKKAEDERKKADNEAKAAKKAEDDKKKEAGEPPAPKTTAAPAAPTAPTTLQSRGTSSRSPRRTSTGGASASSGPAAHSPAVKAALAKRPGDRSDEETLLAASAAKAAKTDTKESWADVTEAAKMDDA